MPAASEERLISADSHVMEPPDLWARNLPERFRNDIRPFRPHRAGAGLQEHSGGHDPSKRYEEMARDGVSAEVLYPTLALELFRLKNWELQEACFRIYNNWLAEYCSHAKSNLIGVAAISAYRPDAAVIEMERCRKLGLQGIQLWDRPHPNMPFHSMHYNDIWSAAQDLSMPVSFHILTGYGHPSFTGTDETPALSSLEATRVLVNMKTAWASDTLYDFIFYGVLASHPKLRIVFVEYEIGWLPFYVSRWDQYFTKRQRKGAGALPITECPSAYVARQVFCTFLSDVEGVEQAIKRHPNSAMWSNDYPHPDSAWPNSRQLVQKLLATATPAVREQIASRNAASLYGIAP